MQRAVFIQSNNKQLLGAKLARYAILRAVRTPLLVSILNVDEMPLFEGFHGKAYLRDGSVRVHDRSDLQSFTLTRFSPPERMKYQGQALVIDPDIFALDDIHKLFDLMPAGAAIMCCPKNEEWDTSVMILSCDKLKHWKMERILSSLSNHTADYKDVMMLRQEKSIIHPLSRVWNSIDELTKETKMLHTSNRLTQPWKTGLPIDFTRNRMPKLFGLIPREWIHKIRGRYEAHYQPHPDPNIERFFFDLVRDALNDKALTEAFVRDEITRGHVRTDFFTKLSQTK